MKSNLCRSHKSILIQFMIILCFSESELMTDNKVIGDVKDLNPFTNYTISTIVVHPDYSNTSHYQRIGLLMFTKYCGPGDRSKTYAEIDQCCKVHDECPYFVQRRSDYNKYPGLMFRFHMFSRLHCKCDGEFYRCLESVNTQYASSISFGYGLFQTSCIDYEHPIVRCTRNEYGRCEEYIVNSSQPKIWQWFDLPFSYRKIYDFPLIRYSRKYT